MLATELEIVHVLLSVPMQQEAYLKQNMTRTVAGTSRAGISVCDIITAELSLSGNVTATVGATTVPIVMQTINCINQQLQQHYSQFMYKRCWGQCFQENYHLV